MPPLTRSPAGVGNAQDEECLKFRVHVSGREGSSRVGAGFVGARYRTTLQIN